MSLAPPDPDLRRQGAAEYLRRLAPLGNEPLPLGSAALAFSTLARGIDTAPYRRHLDDMIEAVRVEAERHSRGEEPSIERRLSLLRQVIVGRWGYRGDDLTYDDLANADLPRVIERRRGLPVALGILYLEVARGQGWEAHGLAFPGHFLLRLESHGYRVIFDPFTGAALSGTEDLRRLAKMVGGKSAELTPAHYQEAPDRDILLRLQNNIKRRHLEQGEDLLAAAALERMTLIAPDRTPLWHELALLDARIGRYSAALDAARHALDHAAGDDERHRLAALVQRLGTRVS